MVRKQSRRDFLKVGGTATVVAAAGCMGSRDDGSSDGGDGSDGGAGDSDGGSGGTGGTTEGSSGPELPSEITFLIYSGGGGFDQYTQAVAPLWEERLAEHGVQSVEIEYEESGGGLVALNTIHDGPPDGSNVLMWNHPGHIISQHTEDIAEYDVREWSHIGQVNSTGLALGANADLPIDDYDDFVEFSQNERPLRVGVTGMASQGATGALLMRDLDGLEAEIVTGYGGSPEYVAAVRRGEVDWCALGIGSLEELLLGTPEGKLVAALNPERFEGHPDVPTRIELGYEPAIYPLAGLARVVSTSPGLPQAEHDVLTETFNAAVESDEMASWSEESGRALRTATREELRESIQTVFDLYEDFGHIFEQN